MRFLPQFGGVLAHLAVISGLSLGLATDVAATGAPSPPQTQPQESTKPKQAASKQKAAPMRLGNKSQASSKVTEHTTDIQQIQLPGASRLSLGRKQIQPPPQSPQQPPEPESKPARQPPLTKPLVEVASKPSTENAKILTQALTDSPLPKEQAKVTTPRRAAMLELLEQQSPEFTIADQAEPESLLSLPKLGQGRFEELLSVHRNMAIAAWEYFDSQYQPQTGLINSVKGYKETTLWDVASAIGGTVAGYELALIEQDEFKQRIGTLLDTLGSMPLYNHHLPARNYHTDTGLPVTNKINRLKNGSGWSALDIARTLGWLAILEKRHPQFQPQIAKISQHWQLKSLINDGDITGARYNGVRERRYQEGRYGYEQYAAAALSLWQLESPNARDTSDMNTTELQQLMVTVDNRNVPFLTSDPFYLALIELGPAAEFLAQDSATIYELHRRRWQQENQIWCFGEDASQHPPWFLYNNLWYQGKAWHSTDYRGQTSKHTQTLSAKCALSWAVLSQDEFGEELWFQARQLFRKEGWFTGRFDDRSVNASHNLNTHAVILTALLYIHNGNQPLIIPNVAVPEQETRL